MNEPTEATHYQIELTSRQVLTALAVLLTCLFAAFFAGVWIGRNAAAERAALELASMEDVAGAEERFDFFSRTTTGGAGSPSPEPGAGLGAQEIAGAETARSERARRASRELDFGPDPDDAELEGANPDDLFAEPGGEALPPPEEMGRSRRGRRNSAAAREEQASPDAAGAAPDSAPAAEIAPDEPAADSRRPAAAADTPPPPPTASGFHIQVLATSDRDKAEALVDRLNDADFKAFVAASSEGGRTVYRVRVGPFPDRALASRQASELESRWGLESWISPSAP